MKILITGSTDGIGKLVSLKLAKYGNEVFLHGRNPQKLEQVVNELKTESKNDNISGFIADFSDLKAVKNMANEILEKLSDLDVLINNAGVFKTTHEMTAEKLDIHFAVNYFAPFILTNSLLPLFEKSISPRVINLSSAAQTTVSIKALKGNDELKANSAYAQSKLALTMWSFYFAKHHKNITTIAVNPGSLLNTKMANEVYGQFWSSADKGANILYELATSDIYKNSSGKYFDNDLGSPKGDFNHAHSDAYNEELIERLITVTKEIIEKKLK